MGRETSERGWALIAYTRLHAYPLLRGTLHWLRAHNSPRYSWVG
jgi:hypothetical protein